MPAGASQKREREFRKLAQSFRQDHRYPGREEEVAARIVNKQRAQYGETRAERDKDRKGTSPDRGLPLKDYQHLTIPQILARLEGLSVAEVRRILAYEGKHKNRKGVVEGLERYLRK